MCIDIKNFYLTAALDYYEYMKIPLALFPEWIKKQYNLDTHAKDGFVFLEIRRAVWGLPQAGILANKLLRKRLKPHGYYECINTPGLWRHETRPITFSLVVDDFGVQYVGLAGNVADMSRHVGDDTTCRSNFGQMGPCRQHKIEDVVAVCVGLSRHLPDFRNSYVETYYGMGVHTHRYYRAPTRVQRSLW